MLSHRLTHLCIALLLGLAAGGCANQRWPEAERIAYPGDGSSQDARFAAVVQRARGAGYIVDELDPARGYVRVRAHRGDGGVVFHSFTPPSGPGTPTYALSTGTSTQSWFTVEVDAEGRLLVDAIGFAVREDDGRIHRKLLAEMEAFAAIVGGAARVAPSSARQTAAARR